MSKYGEGVTDCRCEELTRLRRENKRLRGWLRYWKECHCRGGSEPHIVLVGEGCIDDAIAGKPAPKVER